MEGGSQALHQGARPEEVGAAQSRGRPSEPAGTGGPSPSSCVSSVLSIGASSYSAPPSDARWRWRELPACAREAKRFAAAAREHLTSDVHPARAGDEDEGRVPRKHFWRAVRRWIRNMRDGTTHLFFYAGHGYQFDGDTFLVPTDSEQPQDDIKLSEIRNIIDTDLQHPLRDCRVLFFISACRDAPPDHPNNESRRHWLGDREDNAAQKTNGYLEFFACRPWETVSEAEDSDCGPFALSLCVHLADKTLSVNDLLDKVMSEVQEATDNEEQPCTGLKTLCNFFLHGQPDEASEYSHGLAGPSAVSRTSPVDGHVQWRRRINRLTIQPNIEKPCLVLITDTSGTPDPVSHFNKKGMGPHYIIHADGRATQLVEERLAAWCGNPGFWGELEDSAPIPAGGSVNEVHYFAVSIALEGDGTEREFRAAQYRALNELLQRVMRDHGIRPWNVLGLAEICMPPGKSRAPGPRFEWSSLELAGLALGPPRGGAAGAAAGDAGEDDLRGLMESYGYCLGGNDGDFERRLESFCDRYQRPHDVPDRRSFAPPMLRALLRQRDAARADLR